MASTYYIGTRASWDILNKLVNGQVSKLNKGMSDTLRTVAMHQGIKKTQKGQSLDFYGVDKSQLDLILDPSTAFMLKLGSGEDFRPLITVDGNKMSLALKKVNDKYKGGMNNATYQKYKQDLFDAVQNSVCKVNEDVKTVRKTHGNSTGLKVGDYIHAKFTYRDAMASGAINNVYSNSETQDNTMAIITKITESGYQYRVYVPKYGHNYFADKMNRNISEEGVGSVSYSILDNLDDFELSKVKTARWTKFNQSPFVKGNVSYDKYEFSWDHYR